MRLRLKPVLVILPLLVIVLVALPLLLGATSGGTRWLAERARHVAGDALAWDTLEGQLLGDLQFTGLQLHSAGNAVSIRDLQLRWTPTALLAGRLQVDALIASGIQVSIAEAEPDTTQSAPLRPEDLQPPLAIRVDQLQLRDITVDTGGEAPLRIDSVELVAAYADGALDLREMSVRAPEGSLAVYGEGGLHDALPLDLAGRWQWQLPDQRETTGEFSARGDSARLQLSATASGAFPLQLQAHIEDALGDARWEGELSWPDFAPLGEAEPLRVAAGTLRSNGNLQQYQLELQLALSGVVPEPVAANLQAEGDTRQLAIRSLALDSERGRLDLRGTLAWETAPAAELEFTARLDKLDALQAELPRQLGLSGKLAASYLGDQLELTQMQVRVDDSPAQLAASGSVQLRDAQAPQLQIGVTWRELRWPLLGETPMASLPQGQLTLAGTPDDYRLQLASDVAGSAVPPGQWHMDASGDSGHLQLHELLGELLGGELVVQGDIDWAQAPRWSLRASGRDLDPGQWQADLPGSLALGLSTEGVIDPDTGPRASLMLQRLHGALAGYPLDASAEAGIAGENIELVSARLASGANRLSAAGKVSPETLAIDWQLAVDDPGALAADWRGALSASGQVLGSPDAPRLQAQVESDGLATESQGIAGLRARVQAGLGADDPLELDVRVDTVSADGQALLDSAHLVAQGTTAAHRLRLDASAPSEDLQLQLEGGLQEAAWDGQLTILNLHSAAYGNWFLREAAAVQLAADGQQLGRACIDEPLDQAFVCTGAARDSAGAITLDAELGGVFIDRFAPGITGQVSGDLQASVAVDGALLARADLALSPGALSVDTAQGQQQLPHQGGSLGLTIGAAGLDAQLALQGQRQPVVEAALQLPRFNRLPLAEEQPLRGDIHAEFADLSGLQALVAELGPTSGRLRADLQLAGTLVQPLVLGEVTLRDAAIEVPQAGLKLQAVNFSATGSAEQPGVLAIDGSMRSGQGNIEITGDYALADNRLDLRLRGDRFLAYDTEDARAVLSPDLRLGWDGDLATIRGSLEIPQADVTPQLKLSPGLATEDVAADEASPAVIAPSPDVIVLGDDGEVSAPAAPELPVRLDSEIEVRLGSKVKVRALGFAGGISGGATFVNKPEDRTLVPLAKGRFAVENGTFRAFGQDLEIETGTVLFNGGSATEPEVSLRAVRWIDNDTVVSAAGVQISGPLDEPVLVLFSQPQLDPADIQSYLLTGHSASSRDSVLSIGTYIHRKLYVGYGYNVLAETSEFDALYTITPRYGIEASAGEADNRVNLTFTYER
ncbi:hypothetical protein E4634_09720 [Mangrovimicrobium sediminis]|uniref:Translocation and assembly module TamB C-terminal domain-containing protein n=1 Tax=Mangrovimicrobium sediminis TaxID=2562682 RepID=A0A4Z0M1J1_9GAMM|nr:translocation/assembly module TamB domain-containing protein [Haliea sp. SAOS-164]TGD73306.1 hypothetical protein E4634_09720 [Haliea sp. SAOS-164]